MSRAGVLAFLLLFGLGCQRSTSFGARAPLQSPVALPSRADLDNLTRAPLPALQDPGTVAVEQWDFEGVWQGSTKEGEPPPAPPEQVTAAIAAAGGQNAAALHCVAEQVARLFAKHGGLPEERLLSYMMVRCGGVVLPGHSVSAASVEGPAEVSDDEVLAALLPAVNRDLPGLLGGRRDLKVGSWIHREGRRAALAMIAVEAPAAITVSPVDAQGRVAIRGALAASKGETVGALINRGSHGVEPCTVVRPAPTFELACTLAPEDEQAWIEIYAQPPQHLLSSSLARALAHRRGTSAIAFPTLERSAAVADPASFRVALLAELNQIRTAGGLPPLTLAPVQSTSLDPVAPHIIAALRTKDENRLDQLVLGVAAGWDVQGGVIRDANVSSSFSGHRDARGWLANAGEQPLTRNVLFDPKADQLAVGTAFDTPLPGVSTVVATYQIYDPSELAADTEAAFAALNRARAERGVAPAIRIPDAPELERAALSIPQGTHPEDALQQALEAMSRRHGRQVQGSISLTVSPKETAFPPELLMLPAASVAIRLVHHHLPDSRWGFFIVLIAVDPSAPSQRMAAGPSERRGL